MDVFLLIGSIIIMGFISKYISKKYHISEIITLMLFGIILGPVLNLIDASPGSTIYNIYPFMGSLALILILFDSGISIRIRSLLKTMSRAVIFTLTSFTFTIIATIIFGHFFNISLLYSILIGTILGGTSSITILTMLGEIKIPTETKSLMTTESILTDILVIISVLIIIDYIAVPQLQVDQILSNLLSAISISIIFGVLIAWIWNKLIKNNNFGKSYYVGTLAVLFLLYSVSSYVHASGGLSVFVFAVTFASIGKIYNEKENKEILTDDIRPIHSEIVFFTKTFFFTYIGILYPLWSISVNVVLWSVLLTILFLIARYAAYLLVLARKKAKYVQGLIVPLLPRGLAAVVMVGYVINKGIIIKNLIEIVFTVLFLTSLIGTVGLWVYKKRRIQLDAQKEKEAKKKELSLKKEVKTITTKKPSTKSTPVKKINKSANKKKKLKRSVHTKNLSKNSSSKK